MVLTKYIDQKSLALHTYISVVIVYEDDVNYSLVTLLPYWPKIKAVFLK